MINSQSYYGIQRNEKDYKNLLKQWKWYQLCKLETRIANAFPCNYYCGRNIMIEGTLSFITQGEHCMLVQNMDEWSVIIKLTDLQGYNPEGGSIHLVRKPELQKPNIILQFPTQAIQELALTNLENYVREQLLESPPSN